MVMHGRISSKSSYTYDVSNNQIEILTQQWDGSYWVNLSKSSFAYDANNNWAEHALIKCGMFLSG